MPPIEGFPPPPGVDDPPAPVSHAPDNPVPWDAIISGVAMLLKWVIESHDQNHPRVRQAEELLTHLDPDAAPVRPRTGAANGNGEGA